jgi:uncharacterized protein YoxC
MMSEQSLPLIDRLQERGLIDRWGFMAFGLGGSLLILIAKSFEAPAWSVAAGAVALIFSYAVIVHMKGTGKLRSDQAGDNCYYLGLIFTLTSLAYAIFTFDPNNTATTIVQGFGIALASTIAGLVLRVFFNQSRADLFEVEDTARLELADAAAKLKGELSQVSLSFKEFSIGLQQSVNEVREEAIESVKETSAKAVASIENLANEVRAKLETQATELSTHAKKVAETTESVAASLQRHKKALDDLSDSFEDVSAGIDDMADASESMAKHSAELLAHTSASRDTQSEALALVTKLGQAATDVLASINSSQELAQKWEGEFASRLAELENGPVKTSDLALKAIAKAADGVADAMAKLSQAQQIAIENVATSSDGLLTVVKGHTTELEAELDKSRKYVNEVHSALSDMTSKLADKLSPGVS